MRATVDGGFRPDRQHSELLYSLLFVVSVRKKEKLMFCVVADIALIVEIISSRPICNIPPTLPCLGNFEEPKNLMFSHFVSDSFIRTTYL